MIIFYFSVSPAARNEMATCSCASEWNGNKYSRLNQNDDNNIANKQSRKANTKWHEWQRAKTNTLPFQYEKILRVRKDTKERKKCIIQVKNVPFWLRESGNRWKLSFLSKYFHGLKNPLSLHIICVAEYAMKDCANLHERRWEYFCGFWYLIGCQRRKKEQNNEKRWKRLMLKKVEHKQS